MPRSILFRLSFSLLIGAASLPAATLTDVAFSYNVFTTGSFAGANSDVQGGLAAGGSVSLANYNVGLTSSASDFAASGGYSLVSAGVFSGSNFEVTGNVYYGSAGSLSGYTLHSSSVVVGSSTPVDFAAAGDELLSLSTLLAATSGNSCDMSYGTLTCTATEAGVNYFSVSASDLASAYNIVFKSTYADATIIVNVVGGSSATIGGYGWTFQNTSSSQVLLNYVDATSLNIAGSLSASILAPQAAVTGTYGAMNGTLIARSYSGTTQFNDVSFAGSLPDTAAPEPASFLLAGIGLVALGCLRRRISGASR